MAGDLSIPKPTSYTAPTSPPAKSTAAVYGGGITPFVILSCVVAASGGILFGFDLGISGGVTATGSFLNKFFPDVYTKMKRDNIHVRNYCKFNSQVLTAFTSSLYIAGLFSTLIASRVTEKYGRRPSMFIGGALFLAGSAMGGAAMNIYMLILSRILLGFGVGFTNQVIYLRYIRQEEHLIFNHSQAMATNPKTVAAGEEVRITLFVVLTCMVAGSGGLLFGYDLGISGGVTSMDSFLSKFFPDVLEKMKKEGSVSNYCKFNSQLLMAFTSSLYIAGFVASLLASPVTSRFGRRSSMLFGSVLFLAGAGLSGAGFNLLTIILGRILFGASIGFTNQSVPLYISEMSPPKYRGTMNGFFEICISIGLVAANLINYGTQKIKAGWGWRLSLALAALPASFLLIGIFFLPETPSCIIHRNGDSQKASRILQKIRGTADVHNELNSLISAAADASRAESERPLRRLARRNYRPHIVMAVALPAFRQFTGINFITFYAPVMFRIIGFKESGSLLSALMTRLAATVCNLVTMAVVDKLGRRKFFFLGGAQMIIALAVVGGIMAMKLKDQGAMEDGYAYPVLGFLCIYVAGFSCSWGLLPWLVASEIFPLEIRSTGQSISVALDFLFGSLMAQSMLSILCYMKFGVFFLFAGFVVLMSLFVFWLLPETKELPLEEMGRVWEQHWFWKRFVELDEQKGNKENVQIS